MRPNKRMELTGRVNLLTSDLREKAYLGLFQGIIKGLKIAAWIRA